MAPHSSTCACRPTRSENKGAKVLQRETNTDGKENKQDHSLSHLYTTDPSQMAKVELSRLLNIRLRAMANPEQAAVLKQGVAAWNAWRIKYPDTQPDLQGADLSIVNLSRADLSEVGVGA